jgi:hypothetical protein
VFYRDDVLHLEERQLRELRRHLLGAQRRNRAAERVPNTLLDALWQQVSGERASARGKDEFVDQVGTSDAFVSFVEEWWPMLDAADVWRWLADRERLQHYAKGVLSRDEVDLLLDSWRDGEPSVEDVPLIDELRYLLGDRVEHEESYDPTAELHDETVREVTTADDRDPRRLRTTQRTEDDPHAHVLVDEAQDLSPMQWRMLGRRGRYASWTIVGDPAQSSWPYPEEAEEARAEALRGKDQHRFRLSTNYRNSAEIYDLAARVARAAVADPDLPDAVRRTGEQPQLLTVAAEELSATTRDAVTRMRGCVDGTIGVVAPVARRAEVKGWLADEADPRVRLLEPLDTKGLEFDAIVVVQPGEIAAESETGMRTLYVVLTRATQRLVTVSTDDTWLP